MYLIKEELARLAENSLEKRLVRVTAAMVEGLRASHGEVRVLATFESSAVVFALSSHKAYRVQYTHTAEQVQLGAIEAYPLGVYQESEIGQYAESVSRKIVDGVLENKPVGAQMVALDEAKALQRRLAQTVPSNA